jgi:hypothetical protein
MGGSDLMTVSSVQQVASVRAEETFKAILADRLYDPAHHLFGRQQRVFRRDYEALWPFANAWSAICTLRSLGGQQPGVDSALRAFFEGLSWYQRSHGSAPDAPSPVEFESVVVPPLGGGGDVYFDDSCWLALALMRHDALTGDDRALVLAGRLFELVGSGWSPEDAWAHPGGVRWKVPASCTSRNTCSNAPGAQLAALLYERSGRPALLRWSVRTYEWVRRTLLGPDELYFDRIDPDGTVTEDVWSYNQGTMIGAGVLLHRVTGDEAYLAHAKATANAAMERLSVPILVHPNGPAFNAVFFRNLLLLDEVIPDSRYIQLATAYGNVMWDQHRNARTGVFTGAKSPLNASAPMIEIFALIAGAPPHA